MKNLTMKQASAVVMFVVALAAGQTDALANPLFYSTSNPVDNWFVSTTVNPNGDGQLSSFNTSNFLQAVSVSGRPDYIANNTSGTNGNIGSWTFFVFRQSFDMSGYDASTANLQFQWAADDSGQGFADRGTWTPKFSLNGGTFVPYPNSPTSTYDYSSTVLLNSGFVSGLNTIDFYVEGNGVTDGFKLKTIDFTADQTPATNGDSSNAVPEPATILLMGSGLAGMFFRRK